MPKAEELSILLHRKNMSSNTRTRIVRRTCLHVDVWLIVDTSAANREYSYFVVERRIAGIQLLDRHVFKVSKAEGVVFVGNETPAGRMVSMDSAWARSRWWLAKAYREYIYPNIRRVPGGQGFKGYVSVRIWCFDHPTVERCPDPMDGIINMYAITGRAARDAKFRKREPRGGDIHAIAPHPSEYDKRFASPEYDERGRSILRSLDKLLR